MRETFGYTGKSIDNIVGQYDYGYRHYDPLAGRFTTLDQIQDGDNWYAYCGNDGINLRDPFGLCVGPNDSDAANSQDDFSNWTGVTIGEDIPSTTDIIQESLECRLGQPYGLGNTCDEYVDQSLSGAGLDTSGFFAGPTGPTTVAEHITAAKINGISSDEPDKGASIVFMDDSPPPNNFDPHAGAIIVNGDDSVDYYDSSSNNPSHETTHWKYDNVEVFESAYAYNNFYYIGVE